MVAARVFAARVAESAAGARHLATSECLRDDLTGKDENRVDFIEVFDAEFV